MAENIPMTYVSPVEGRMCPRFGKGEGRSFIGVTLRIKRNSAGVVLSRKVVCDPDRVIAIPTAEFNRYGKEYRRAFKDKSLTKRTAADYDAHQKQAGEGALKAKKERKAKQKEAAEAASGDSGLDGDGDAGPGKDDDTPKRRRRKIPGDS